MRSKLSFSAKIIVLNLKQKAWPFPWLSFCW